MTRTSAIETKSRGRPIERRRFAVLLHSRGNRSEVSAVYLSNAERIPRIPLSVGGLAQAFGNIRLLACFDVGSRWRQEGALGCEVTQRMAGIAGRTEMPGRLGRATVVNHWGGRGMYGMVVGYAVELAFVVKRDVAHVDHRAELFVFNEGCDRFPHIRRVQGEMCQFSNV